MPAPPPVPPAPSSSVMFDRYAPLMGPTTAAAAAPSTAVVVAPSAMLPPAQKAITHEYRDQLMPMRQGTKTGPVLKYIM